MKPALRIGLLAAALALGVCAAASAAIIISPGKDKKVEPKVNRAQWMADGRYGIMVHYLPNPEGDTPEQRTASYNKTVDGFDLDGFMRQFQESGAKWLIFTIGQNTGYYCSPNGYLDNILGGHTSSRDLLFEIARSVHVQGKRFICYLPVEVASQRQEVKDAFAWNPSDQSQYQQRYLQFVEAYSKKLGSLCDGWWFDGWYEPIVQGKWAPQRWIDACRAGNPKTIVAFNDAAFCAGHIDPITPLEDYHAGEVHLLEDGKIRTDFIYGDATLLNGKMRNKTGEPRLYLPTSQFIGGVQWHALVPVDSTFNPAVPVAATDYPDSELMPFMKACISVGGAVTLNVPIDMKGRIPEETLLQLRRVGEAVSKMR